MHGLFIEYTYDTDTYNLYFPDTGKLFFQAKQNSRIVKIQKYKKASESLLTPLKCTAQHSKNG